MNFLKRLLNLFLRFLFLVSVFLIFNGTKELSNAESLLERVNIESLANVIRTVEEIDAMRSTLAKSINPSEMEIDQETFAMVCKPVGKKVKQIARKNGWEFRQLSVKYRNPRNKADSQALQALKNFEMDPGLQGFWEEDSKSKKFRFRYFRKIVVEPACLYCHGPKENRPNFIKNKYSDDRAFDFLPGDLRGVYSISFKK